MLTQVEKDKIKSVVDGVKEGILNRTTASAEERNTAMYALQDYLEEIGTVTEPF